MNSTDIAVAIYDSHQKAESAVKTLQRGGFDMKKLSIIGKDYHTEEHVVGYFNLAHFMAAGCTTRASAKSVGAAGRASAGLPTAGPSMPLLTRMNFRFTQPESE